VPIVNTEAGYDYDEGALHKVLAKHWELVVTTVVKLYKSGQYDLANRHVAAICPGVIQAEEITAAIKKLGIAAECITNKTKDDERERILQAADRGEVNFLASVFALREGWDCKLFEVALMLRPTRSRVLYIQFMGRVLRLFLDKVALVVDPFFLNTRFSPLSAPILFGLPGQKVIRGDIFIGPGGKKPPSPYLVKLIEQSTPTLIIEHSEIEHWADESGFFEVDGERWGTRYAFTRETSLSNNAIVSRLTTCRKRLGRTVSGRLTDFYALSDVLKACKNLLDLPQAEEGGTFEEEGETWGTTEALARKIGINATTIKNRISSHKSRNGRDVTGNPAKFYALSDAKQVCADLLDLPQAEEGGTFEEEGETWGTTEVFGKKLGLSPTTIGNRIVSCRGREGKVRGKRATFYSLSDVKKACADLLEDLPQAGEDGILRAGEEWATLNLILHTLKFSASTEKVQERITTCVRRTKIGKIAGGQRVTFYPLSEVRAVCADLLEELPQADKEGFFWVKGEEWGLLAAIARRFDRSTPFIQARVKTCRKREGRESKGHCRVFYSVTDVNSACAADLLTKKRSSTKK
jgi:biotin operon repressor